MASADMRIKFYGVRGSFSPTKMTQTQIGVNTCCVRLDIDDQILIFDAGSGIINCGNDLVKQFRDSASPGLAWKTHLFFSHHHLDHLNGFPFFPLLYCPQAEVHLLSPRILQFTLEETLNQLVAPPFFPVSFSDLSFRRHFHELTENRVVYFYPDRLQIVPLYEPPPDHWVGRVFSLRHFTHPKGGAFFYRIEAPSGKRVVLAVDAEGFVGGDQRLVQFARDADVLIHDAHYTPEEYLQFQGYGHSSYAMACDVARQAHVKKLVLIHHNPERDDRQLRQLELSARKLFPQTILAVENMELTV